MRFIRKKQYGGDETSLTLIEDGEVVKTPNGDIIPYSGIPKHNSTKQILPDGTEKKVKKGDGGAIVDAVAVLSDTTNPNKDRGKNSPKQAPFHFKFKKGEEFLGLKLKKGKSGSPSQIFKHLQELRDKELKRYDNIEYNEHDDVSLQTQELNEIVKNTLPTDEEIFDGLLEIQEIKKDISGEDFDETIKAQSGIHKPVRKVERWEIDPEWQQDVFYNSPNIKELERRDDLEERAYWNKVNGYSTGTGSVKPVYPESLLIGGLGIKNGINTVKNLLKTTTVNPNLKYTIPENGRMIQENRIKNQYDGVNKNQYGEGYEKDEIKTMPDPYNNQFRVFVPRTRLLEHGKYRGEINDRRQFDIVENIPNRGDIRRELFTNFGIRKSQIEESKKRYEKYHNSPLFRDRLLKMGVDNSVVVPSSDDVNVYGMRHPIGKGVYNRDLKNININIDIPNKGAILDHEFSHHTDSVLNKNTEKYIRGLPVKQEGLIPFMVEGQYPKISREVRADIMSLRGILDASGRVSIDDGNYSPEDIEYLKSTENWKRINEIYEDEQIEELLNNLAINNTNTPNINVAQYGKLTRGAKRRQEKFARKGDFTDFMEDTRNGTVFNPNGWKGGESYIRPNRPLGTNEYLKYKRENFKGADTGDTHDTYRERYGNMRALQEGMRARYKLDRRTPEFKGSNKFYRKEYKNQMGLIDKSLDYVDWNINKYDKIGNPIHMSNAREVMKDIDSRMDGVNRLRKKHIGIASNKYGGIPRNINGLYEEEGPVIVPSNNITMEGINTPVDSYDPTTGEYLTTMYPGENYYFPDVEEVLEVPVDDIPKAQGGRNFRESYYHPSLSRQQIDRLYSESVNISKRLQTEKLSKDEREELTRRKFQLTTFLQKGVPQLGNQSLENFYIDTGLQSFPSGLNSQRFINTPQNVDSISRLPQDVPEVDNLKKLRQAEIDYKNRNKKNNNTIPGPPKLTMQDQLDALIPPARTFDGMDIQPIERRTFDTPQGRAIVPIDTRETTAENPLAAQLQNRVDNMRQEVDRVISREGENPVNVLRNKLGRIRTDRGLNQIREAINQLSSGVMPEYMSDATNVRTLTPIEIDPTPYLDEVDSAVTKGLQNVNTNTAQGQAIATNVMMNALRNKRSILNQVNSQNQNIRTQVQNQNNQILSSAEIRDDANRKDYFTRTQQADAAYNMNRMNLATQLDKIHNERTNINNVFTLENMRNPNYQIDEFGNVYRVKTKDWDVDSAKFGKRKYIKKK